MIEYKIKKNNLSYVIFIFLTIFSFVITEKAKGNNSNQQVLDQQVQDTYIERQYRGETGSSNNSYEAGDFWDSLDEVSGKTNIPDIGSDGVRIVLDNFLGWMLGIFGILALISFVISGIIYITSSGNQSQIDMAKKAMTWSIVGVVVALSGMIIIITVESILGLG